MIKMPDTPLNPDALEAAAKALWEWWNPELPWEENDDRTKEQWRDEMAKAALSAYLAVAQPEVKSVEELDALPIGTVVYANNHIGPAERFDIGWMGCGNTAAWSSPVLARDGLPARVLYRPEVKR